MVSPTENGSSPVKPRASLMAAFSLDELKRVTFSIGFPVFSDNILIRCPYVWEAVSRRSRIKSLFIFVCDFAAFKATKIIPRSAVLFNSDLNIWLQVTFSYREDQRIGG